MLLRTVISLCLLVCLGTAVNAQTGSSADSLKATPDTQATEEVDGIFAFAGYLGRKLVDEVSDQFDDEAPKPKEKVKRVRIKLGPIKIERIEKR